jgi:dienelactone hydrolase
VELQPRLIDVELPAQARGAVIVLHGGASRRENMMVSPTQLSVLRMVPIARRIARAGRGQLAVFRLLNSRRGWETRHTPVADAVWALRQMRRRLGRTLPTCLVGHSLGGRAALLTAGEPEVVSAVALAPWLVGSDLAPGIDGKEFLIVHGSRDRVASPERAAQVARRMRAHARVEFVTVDGGRHAMLRRHDAFSRLAAEFVVKSLLGTSGALLDSLDLDHDAVVV